MWKVLQNELKDLFSSSSQLKIHVLNESAAVLFTLSVSLHKTVTVKCIVQPDYPSSPALIELESHVIPAQSLAKVKFACENEAKRLSETNSVHVKCIHDMIKAILENNKLLLCVPQLEKIKQDLLTGPNDSMKLHEKKGIVNIHVEEKGFTAEFSLKISAMYPVKPVEIQCKKCDYPEKVAAAFVAQASNIAIRCSQGKSIEEKPVEIVTKMPADEHISQPIGIDQYRHDVKFLKERSEYRKLASKKQSRRDLLRFDRHELNREIDTQKSLSTSEPSHIEASANTIAGLLPVAYFLIQQFVKFLPYVRCALCKGELGENFKLPKECLPERVLCGHWFHRECLKRVMTEPPFGKQCPGEGCPFSVYSTIWKLENNAYERKWAMEQAHKREMEEINDFLDF
ncbi:hypothetical protein IE077_002162 [Cardiosporidium cionae]|uniref:RING-type domain-containing protein n=1 Tax=Cardiosporidium cionae TaxID=476202 RepID=A0ABQ7JBI1_9APIC|nr:hypothetical protein IE077_002162 [Cardiosporidium cionae]|eukprot:KAF8821314.1 hypothetical protein IE077_002162 [Cardiosporidium cionae]